jgi:glyoxylase-like metal-dependent hydrolase (beta-lactamase superfamily II)
MLRWKIGEVTITRVVELEGPGLRFVLPDAVPDNLRQIPWLRPHFVNEEFEALASVATFVIESQGRRIMVDTCIGNDKTLEVKFWSNRRGPFLREFEAAGYARDSIDTVLCTHLHPDHVGWNTVLVDGTWTPTFPKASYLFGRTEWEHWNATQDKFAAILMEQSVRPVVDAGLHTLVETNHRITDEVWLEPTPGHTPGHASVHISSKGVEAVITGDLMHHPVQMAKPDWVSLPDSDGVQARATRKDFMRRYANSPTLVIGTHFYAPTAGKIVPDGDVWRFVV